MKNVFLFLIIFVFNSFGQDALSASGIYQIEPIIGFGFSRLDGDELEPFDNYYSYSLGVQGRYSLDNFSLLTGLLYANRTAILKEEGVSTEGAYSVERVESLSLVVVPIVLAYEVTPGWKMLLGPQIWSNIDTRAKIEGELAGVSQDKEIVYDENLRTLGVSFLAGGEFQIHPQVNISVRYDYQISSVVEETNAKFHELGLFASYGFEL